MLEMMANGLEGSTAEKANLFAKIKANRPPMARTICSVSAPESMAVKLLTRSSLKKILTKLPIYTYWKYYSEYHFQWRCVPFATWSWHWHRQILVAYTT